MTSIQRYRASGGKLAFGIVMAVIFGALSPIITILEMSMSVMMPVIMFGGLFMVFLNGYAGRVPAWIFMIVQLACAVLTMNATFMWMLLMTGTMPAVIVMRGMETRRPFFEQMRSGIIAYGLGLVVALFIAYAAYGGNMIGRLTDLLRAQFDLIPDEGFAPLVDALNSTIASSGLTGFNLFTVESYRNQIIGVLSMLEEAYSQAMPGALISGALLTGLLSVLWGNWLCARHGLSTRESFVDIERWFLPGHVAIGLSVMWLASYAVSKTNYASGDTVYVAVYNIISAAFGIQAIAAINRILCRRGATARRKCVITGVLILFGLIFRLLGTALFIIGAVSALFGSHGALRRMAVKSSDDHSGDDDPDQ